MIEQPFSDLDAWVAYFCQEDIPVLRHTVQELERLRADAEKVNGHVLAAVILQDPLMTLRVLAYIEERRRKSQTTDITTIERALLMIGVDPFFRDFQDLPLIEDRLIDHPSALLGLLKTISRARRSAHWARDWAIFRHDVDVDEITVATLLYDIAEILMWLFAPTLALKVLQVQQNNRNRRSATIQHDIYGIPLFELKLRLIKAWHLPELLATLVDDRSDSNPRVRNVKLAVDLARHSANGWDDAALPDDFKGICDLLHISQPTLIHRLGITEQSGAAEAN
jgi:HD-like signal output (HDOD) protein